MYCFNLALTTEVRLVAYPINDPSALLVVISSVILMKFIFDNWQSVCSDVSCRIVDVFLGQQLGKHSF